MKKSDPQEFFPYHGGKLFCEEVDLSEILRKHGSPTYVYSHEGFRSPVERLKTGLSGLPVQICFAMKSNSNPELLKILKQCGIGIDLVSGGEMRIARSVGFSGNQMVFSGVGKLPEEIESALKNDVFSFHVESIPELDLIQEILEARFPPDRRARVALRFNPDVNPKTHPYISTGLRENKFGLEKSEILWVAKNLKNWPRIQIAGLSIHIGSQLVTLAPMKEAFQKLKSCVETFESLSKIELEYVDLGGGLGIRYKNEKPPTIEDYCKLIQKEWSAWIQGRRAATRVFLEPGRLISGNAGVLLTQVQFRKERKSRTFLIVDAAMNDLARPSLYGSYHEIIPLNSALRKGKTASTDIVGPACETADRFASGRKVPVSWKRGEFLALLSCGAYGYSMASNYNSRPRPAEVLVKNKEFFLIRDREKIEPL
ncbi:MAG: diaminopimelate decarboxylase [Bdellovibrionales bacterium]|nr:diaminopimelate decarboxylase [Bdellovibrionales bacterium]